MDQILPDAARFIAAEQPPHLKAMAPWEGLGDYYRESICRGGIPDISFWGLLLDLFAGTKRIFRVKLMRY
jgi:predicted acyl esterase